MTQFPAQPPADQTVSYGGPGPKTSGMAIASMVLGIVSIPLLCLGIGVLLGMVGLILGIMALVSINKEPMRRGGMGFAIAGIVIGALTALVGVPLIIAVALPSFGRARELSNRSVCAANLRGMMQSMTVYAAGNNDAFPIVSTTGGYSLAAGGGGLPGPNADSAMISMYKTPGVPSVTQNMWLLVVSGLVSPKQFLCKSDLAVTTPASLMVGGEYQVNFNDGSATRSDFSYSYSFAYPWKSDASATIGGWWQNRLDASTPLMADMAPLSGSGRPVAIPENPLGAGRDANSFTHQRDGENIGFGDGHVDFVRRPDAGYSNDNIYTFNSGRPSTMGTAFKGGVPNIMSGGSAGNWDICMVPAADADAGYARK